MDAISELAEIVSVIKSDPDLRNACLEILKQGSYSQQVRVDKIAAALDPVETPEAVSKLLSLLRDDKIANLVYAELMK